MIKRNIYTKFFVAFMIIIFTLPIFAASGNAASSTTTSKSTPGSSNGFLWDTEDMIGPVDNGTVILHEQYPNTFSRYGLDAPLNIKVWDDAPWYKPNVVKRVEDASSSWSENRITTIIANIIFYVVKFFTLVSIYSLQLAMGAKWTTALFSIFGAITQVIGVTLITKNLFYVASLCLGGYLLWQGLIKRKLSTTIGETLLSVALLAFTIFFVSNPAKVMTGINSGTDLIGTWILQLAVTADSETNLNAALKDQEGYVDTTVIDNKVSSSTSMESAKNAAIVDISNKLWSLQVRGPWDIMQFGEIEVNLSDPTKNRGNVTISSQEYDAIKEILKNNSVNISGSGATDEQLAKMGIVTGASWGKTILGLSSDSSELRSILISVLGNKGADSKSAVSTHDKAVEALNDGATKVFITIVLAVTSGLTLVYIAMISLGLFLAQMIVLVSMVIGPFVLMLSALPKFGHRYIKNWGLITLGAFGTKIIHFTLISIMFVLMSIFMNLAFNINNLNIDTDTKAALTMFSPDGATSLLLVQLMIIAMMELLNRLRKKIFAHNKEGSFSLAGAVIHNATNKDISGGIKAYSAALQGQSYGQHIVGSREKKKFDKDMAYGSDKRLQEARESREAEEKDAYQTNQEYGESSATQVAQNQEPSSNDDYSFEEDTTSPASTSGIQGSGTLGCPINGSQCTNESTAFGNGSAMCSVTGKICPFRNMSDTDNYEYMMKLKNAKSSKKNSSKKEENTPNSPVKTPQTQSAVDVQNANNPRVRRTTTDIDSDGINVVRSNSTHAGNDTTSVGEQYPISAEIAGAVLETDSEIFDYVPMDKNDKYAGNESSSSSPQSSSKDPVAPTTPVTNNTTTPSTPNASPQNSRSVPRDTVEYSSTPKVRSTADVPKEQPVSKSKPDSSNPNTNKPNTNKPDTNKPNAASSNKETIQFERTRRETNVSSTTETRTDSPTSSGNARPPVTIKTNQSQSVEDKDKKKVVKESSTKSPSESNVEEKPEITQSSPVQNTTNAGEDLGAKRAAIRNDINNQKDNE